MMTEAPIEPGMAGSRTSQPWINNTGMAMR